ncbi:MAG: hypothetical protein IPK16_33990 [Anaerolineales bacterium]|nr:hypothetical protein [Anaerolineales bacterium]
MLRSSHSRTRRTLLSIAAFAVVVSLLLSPLAPVTSTLRAESRSIAAIKAPVRQEGEPMTQAAATPGDSNGLTLLLTDGSATPQTGDVGPAVAPSEPLAAEAVQPILDRLTPLDVTAAPTTTFQLPPESLPPPVAGQTIEQPFPPESQEAAPEVIPTDLQVQRYAPVGEIPMAPFLNVTFNQPMIPLATLDQLNALDVPVQLTPEAPGVWQWLGTQTLSFQYKSDELARFPMATVYTATVPAGVTAVSGAKLAEAVTWTFNTPPPVVVNKLPGNTTQPRDPLMFVAFNQQIEPAAVLETIRVAAGGQAFPLRLATTDEVAANGAVAAQAKYAGEGRWVAFKSDTLFPENTTVTVDIGPGTPSAEGPLTTTAVQSYSFQTYGPLKIMDSSCYGPNTMQCPPGSPFMIRFSNNLDTKQDLAAQVSVEPAIPGMIVSAYGDTLQINGATAGRTTYAVALKAGLTDIYSQTLGFDQIVTFHTGNAESYLTGSQGVLTTLDPTAPQPVFTVYSVNYDKLRVRAYRVTPEDWQPYLEYRDNFYRDKSAKPPGEEVINTVIDVQGKPDTLTETSIDLSPALGGKPGQLIVVVDKPGSILSLFMPSYDYVVQSWVQSTNIGLDAINDSTQLVAWATRLSDGAPLPETKLELTPSGGQALTAADGLARFELSASPATILVATNGDDLAILPRSMSTWDTTGWTASPQDDELRWYVFDDRGMYRPGESVHVKGFLRNIGAGVNGDVTLQKVEGASVTYTVNDPQYNPIANGEAKVDSLGGFDLVFTLPVASNLGYANIQFSAQNTGLSLGTDFYHSFQVQEFRRPEFAVSARNETPAPYYLGGDATVAVSAEYYAGGPLPGAETTWDVSAQATSYSPPNWPDFVFGEWIPWWFGGPDYGRGGIVDFYYPGPGGDGGGDLEFTQRTDATGNAYMKMDFVKADEPRPYSVNANVRVMDVNQQAWASSTSVLVHPSKLYVGLRSDDIFVQPGDPFNLSIIVTDVDGNAVADAAVKVRSVLLAWEFTEGAWRQVEQDEQLCEVTSAGEPVNCSLPTTSGGEYQITAEVRDDVERLNRTTLTRGSPAANRRRRDLTQQQLTLIPDKEEYQPGDVARILVQAPFANGEGLMTLSRSGIVSTESFSLDGGAATLDIPIEAGYLPNLNVQIDVNGSSPRLDDKGQPIADAPNQPAYATGALNLSIPPLARTLTMTLAPAATQLEPGQETSLTVNVKDAQGQPVQDAELAVVVVDESILALSNYTLADPISVFYAARGSNTNTQYGRSTVTLANPQDVADAARQSANAAGGAADMVMAAAMPTMMMESDGMAMAAAPAAAEMAFGMPAPPPSPMEKQAQQPDAPIAERTDLNPLALFAPDVRTDAEGNATVTYKLPDNLTRYRVMVVAATEQDFASAETNITARKPLMVRPSAPRFLNFGDQVELPVVIQNQTDTTLTVDVVAEAGNLVLTGAPGQRVAVPANDRVSVLFPATTENVGTALVRLTAVSGAYADSQSVTLPVYTPATTEAFATYGVIDEGSVAQAIAQPQDVFPQFGGLSIGASSTALQSLTDAVMYLQNYPFECSEQLASRVFSVADLRDVLTAFQSPNLPSPVAIEAAMKRDIERLQQLQNYDGGWPVWDKGDESVAYNSVFVTHALVEARSKDYAVDQQTLDSALNFLRDIDNYFPTWYNANVRQTITAYALYVRMLLGDVDYTTARSVYAAMPVDEQPLEALAWLWQVLAGDPQSTAAVAEIQRRINNSAVETAGMANFFSSYDDQGYVLLHSNRRTDAIVLDALIAQTPESDLIPKVVAGLMAARDNAGHWNNTQENVFVIIAMDDYFNTFENVEPDFIARVWLGDTYVAEDTFKGYSTETQETLIPMQFLVDEIQGTENLIISKEGDGRLYYRLGLEYAPTDLGLDALDRGFIVQRTYEAVDDPEDVRRDGDGTWIVKLGARVRVRLTMVANNRRYHVALVDRLPAGMEIINPDLAVSESVPADPASNDNYGWWWWYTWYDHQNLRDAGAEAFTTYLWDGVYDYSYVTRATTSGEFVVPPAKAEEMYSPEVFGRSAADKVVVK